MLNMVSALDAGTEGQDTATTNPESSNLVRENQSLKLRIRQLELALSRPELVKLETASSPVPPPDPQSSDRIMSDFQTQAFGFSVEPTPKIANITRPRENSVKLILPTRRWSERIIDFSLVQLGWVHYAVDDTTFREEHNAFWDTLIEHEKESFMNHGWIAVYLSLLAVGVYFMSEEDLHGIQLLYENFSHQTPSTVSSLGKNPCGLARTWYEAALRELDLADYTRNPALSTVQTVAILNLVHKNMGESTREYILHGLAVNVARLIGMDHAGDTSNTEMGGINRVQQIVHQRLWWTLVICDWMTIWSRPVSIHPGSFTTVMGTTPSPHIEYHKFMARVATMARNNITPAKELSPGALQACFEEVDNVRACFPPPPNDSIHDDPLWNTIQYNLALNCVESWRLALYVAMLPKVLDDSSPSSHTVLDPGIIIAKQILQRTYNNSNPVYHKFWSVNSAVASAGIFLALDLICFQRRRSPIQVSEQKDLVALSLKMVEQSIAETRHDGILVLRRLTHLYDTVRPAYMSRVDRNVLAKIVRLVAFPRLWNSLTSTDAIMRFLFQDAPGCNFGSSSSSPPDSDLYPSQSGLCLSSVPQMQSGEFGAWGLSETMEQEEMVPYFGQVFPSAELINLALMGDL
ncbi:hypothetical protein N7481_000406 [Penicillium waksmanii]|uniref:uncharacterized protein n=1 Tax=Penicillium waksmanii TaxID=69791 RepID=UPI0025477537|nr:uncharacterized protein N7481_000406 [Penicillium waksmanii]KAJ5999997.1 hypothetical protein N7481_000406 [Penicillium waksmanii]